MSKQQKVKVAPVKKVMPKVQLISDEEYGETMKRLMDIQVALKHLSLKHSDDNL